MESVAAERWAFRGAVHNSQHTYWFLEWLYTYIATCAPLHTVEYTTMPENQSWALCLLPDTVYANMPVSRGGQSKRTPFPHNLPCLEALIAFILALQSSDVHLWLLPHQFSQNGKNDPELEGGFQSSDVHLWLLPHQLCQNGKHDPELEGGFQSSNAHLSLLPHQLSQNG